MPTGLCATQGPGLAGNLEEAQRCGEDDERRRQGPAVCGDHGHVAAVLFQGSDGCRRWGLDRGLAGSWAASGKAQVALPPTSSEVITPALPPGTHESKDASCPSGTCRVPNIQAVQQGAAEGREAVPEHDIHCGDGLGVAQAQRGQRGEVAVEKRLVVGVDAAGAAGVSRAACYVPKQRQICCSPEGGRERAACARHAPARCPFDDNQDDEGSSQSAGPSHQV